MLLNELGDLQMSPRQQVPDTGPGARVRPSGAHRAPVRRRSWLYTLGVGMLEDLGDHVYGVTGFLVVLFWVLLMAVCLLVWAIPNEATTETGTRNVRRTVACLTPQPGLEARWLYVTERPRPIEPALRACKEQFMV